MPPQHGKSELSTRRLPAFLLGKNPDLKIGVIAYNHTVAASFNRDCQRIIDSEQYNILFPNTRLNNSNVRVTQKGYLRNSDEFEIVGHTGSLISVGVGGGLTSRTIDILIMDDLYKDAKTAWSSTIRESTQDWYDSVATTRLHNDSQQLIVFTRWHEEDLAGQLLRREGKEWEVVTYPAIKIEQPTEHDPREIGEPLWAEKHELKKMLKIKKNSEVIFDSLYQQNPTPKEGLLFPASDMKRFSIAHIKDTIPTAVVAACDTADEGDDSLSVPIGNVYGKDTYITEVIFTQDAIEITQPRVAELLDRRKVNRTRFESNNGGKGYAQKVRELKKGRTTIDWKHTSTNKHTRIIMNSGQIKESFYFLVDEEQNEEYKKFFYELTHYPKNGKVKHDDAADATTMLNEFIFGHKKNGW